MKHLTVMKEHQPIYNIHFEDSFENLYRIFSQWQMKDKKVCIITDSNVEKYYLDEVVKTLLPTVLSVKTYSFLAGEKSKNLDTVYKVYDFLIQEKFDRKDMLIALGGGVVGDLTGYVAATYLRGIEFVQIPTTLLSMVDSSIGGKTGVDFGSYKNMIGAFHQPKMVYMNFTSLMTLNNKEYIGGLAEVIKHGFIKDYDYFTWLLEHKDGILHRDMELLYKMISQSCNIKRKVVENDPKEQGERALLNFGHTIGHGIEKFMEFNLLHGECVSLGMVAASYISYTKGYLKVDELIRIIESLKAFELLTHYPSLDRLEVLSNTKLDKKMESGNLKFILLHAIGNGVIDTTVSDEDIIKAINFITKESEWRSLKHE